MNTRSKGEVTEAALYIAKRHGLRALTRERVAAQARVSSGTVSNTFGDMRGLVSAVVQLAAEREVHSIVAEAMVYKLPVVNKLSREVKLAAMNHAITKVLQ